MCKFKGGRENILCQEIKECEEMYNKERLIHSLIDSSNPNDISIIKGLIN